MPHRTFRLPSPAFRVLIALAAGLSAGMVFADRPERQFVLAALEPVGRLWVNALRMCVTPLVVSCLVVSVGSTHNTGAMGRLGGRAVMLFLSLLTCATIFSVAVGLPLLSRFHVDPQAAMSLRQAAQETAAAQNGTSMGDWISGLMPTNPVKAASDAAMLPLIVFALLLGLALRRVGEEPGQAVLAFFHGLAEAMFVLVRWVLAWSPAGVFALAVPLAMQMGPAAVGALSFYVWLVLALTTAFGLLVLYPLVIVASSMPLRRFVRGTLPAQVVAFGSRSSIASLPLMIESARTTLGLSEEVTVFLVPLAGSVFRVGSAIAQTIGVLFVARLYNVPLGNAQLVTIIAIVVLTTFSVPGIPSGSIIAMAPVVIATGLPLSSIGLLLAVDSIPDMIRTVANVTGSMAAAVVLGRATSAPPGVRSQI